MEKEQIKALAETTARATAAALVCNTAPKYKVGDKVKANGQEGRVIKVHPAKAPSEYNAYDVRLFDGNSIVGEIFVTEDAVK